MRVVGLEEHFVSQALLDAWQAMSPGHRDLAYDPASEGETHRRLLDTGEERLAAMDRTGLDVQVLSLTTPGVQNVQAAEATVLQRDANDLVASVVDGRPDRYSALAGLPTPDPAAAADELGRAVTELGLDGAVIFGRTGDHNLDHPSFWPVFEAAEALRAPLHLHPQSPPHGVQDVYYTGFADHLSIGLATHGLGWHYDAGVQFLRLVLSGVFDRFPELQVVLGHWGELVLFYLDRIQQLESAAGLARPLAEYARNNVYVTPSGILSPRYLRWATEIVGPDRILFATDYPFEPASLHGARQFLEDAALSQADRCMIAAGNWDRVRAGIRR